MSHSHQSERCSSGGRGCLCHHDGSSLSVCLSPTTPLQHITDVHIHTHTRKHMQRREDNTFSKHSHICRGGSTRFFLQTHTCTHTHKHSCAHLAAVHTVETNSHIVKFTHTQTRTHICTHRHTQTCRTVHSHSPSHLFTVFSCCRLNHTDKQKHMQLH